MSVVVYVSAQIKHQYTLMDEQGPAHKKTFFVQLTLGGEEYRASGPSIKKAQHSAAAIALTQTELIKPPARQVRATAMPVRTVERADLAEANSKCYSSAYRCVLCYSLSSCNATIL